MAKDSDDIEKQLLARNIYFLNGDITADSANQLIRWLIYHNTNIKTKKELSIYILGSIKDRIITKITIKCRYCIKENGNVIYLAIMPIEIGDFK